MKKTKGKVVKHKSKGSGQADSMVHSTPSEDRGHVCA